MIRRSQVFTVMNSLLTFRLLHLVQARDLAVAFLATAALLFSNCCSSLQAQIDNSWTLAEIRAEFQNADSGDTITFANGTYTNIGDLVLNNKSTITIQGSGAGTIIDGVQQKNTIFDINNSSEIVIRGFTLKNASQDIGYKKKGVVHINNSTNVTVEDCVIEVRWTQGGVFIQQGGGNTIQRNVIFNPDRTDYGTLSDGYPADLIFVQRTNGVTIDDNDLLTQSQPFSYRVDGNRDTEPTHLDGIQFYEVKGDCVVSNNLVKVDTTWARQHHAILIEQGGSTAKYVIYNNVFYGAKDGQFDALVSLQATPDLYYFVNNVVEGDSPQIFRIQTGNSNSQFKNNIFYRRSNGNMIEIDINNSGDWTNNLFWSESNATGQSIVNYVYSLSQLNNLGGRFSSNIQQDPLLTDDWHILPGSNAQDNGTNVSALTGSSNDIDGDQRNGSWDIGVDEIAGATVEESVSIEGPPIINDSGTAFFLVDYVTNTQRDIIVDVFDSNWNFKGESRYENLNGPGSIPAEVSYNQINTPTAIVMVSLLQDNGDWQTWVKRGFMFDVEVNSSAPESISGTAPPSMASSGSAEFTIDYVANSTRDILIDVFDSNWGWKGKRRINNVSGSGSNTWSVNYSNISTATSNIKVSLLVAGGTWQDLVESDVIFNVPVGGSAAPDFALNLWNATPSSGVNTHNTWGVSGLAPNRHLQLVDVDLSTGYNKFEFEYASGHGAAMSYEVRLDSPNGQLLGTSNFSGTGSWAKSSAEFADANLTPVTGTRDVFIVIKSGYMNAFTCWFRNE